MKTLLLATVLLFINFNLHAKIIYIEPIQNARYVNTNINLIFGFDGTIVSSDLSSRIKVNGSLSGIHTGEFVITRDKEKIIFKPDLPFAFNETVHVELLRLKTSTSSNNSLDYTFQTQINKPEWDQKNNMLEETGYSFDNDFGNYGNTAALPVISVTINNNPSPGYLFMSNFPYGNFPNTPYLLILKNDGTPYYSRELNDIALDFKKQPNGMLTYWYIDKFYAEDIHSNIIDSFSCGNGYGTDQHELLILGNGHALLMSYDPQIIDMSLIVPGGNPNATVLGLIVQELDENKNVVFQWRSWDHIAITEAIHENLTAPRVDYIHGNALDLDIDGNIMLSSRHLSEITKINRTTGDFVWRMGGIHNQFTFINDPLGFSYQHCIRRIANGHITLYDNGNFHPTPFSRAVEYTLDEVNRTVTLAWQYRHSPDIYGFAMGYVQRLQNGNTLISWGATSPTVTEVRPSGNIALEMSLPQNIYTYRTLKYDMSLTLNATLAIEGLLNIQTGRLLKKDTVKVYLRGINSPYNIVDSSKSVIDSVSLLGTFKFNNASSGTYYIIVKHRNSIETWSRSGGEPFIQGNIYDYDFTDSDLKAYGNNLVLKGSKYCIYSGDVNQNGSIDLSDIQSIDNGASQYQLGYVSNDINGDNFVDISDLSVSDDNASGFIHMIRP
jgi:hypothetical protein